MKKAGKYLFLLCLGLCFLLFGSAGGPFVKQAHAQGTFSGAGSGTAADPFIITHFGQLNEINNNLNAHYKLGGNIEGWGIEHQPIQYFKGVFDGDFKTISGLSMDFEGEGSGGSTGRGLFGRLEGTVKNLILADVNVRGSRDMVGALAGHVTKTGRVEKVAVIGGQVYGSPGKIHIGGLVGCNEGVIDQCYTQLGLVQGGQVIGGLVGFNSLVLIVGGDQPAVVSNSYSDTILTKGDSQIGGLAGFISEEGSIVNCYANGAVEGWYHTDQNYIGGLVGYRGYYFNRIWFSYFNEEKTGQNTGPQQLGTPKSDALMKHQGTFQTWDFDNTWYMVEGATYPILRWLAGDMIAIDSLIAEAWDSLEVGYAQGDNANSVTANLILPTSGLNGTSVTWTSSEPAFITNAGVVARPAGVAKIVTLTATVSKAGGNSRPKPFVLTVAPEFAGGAGTPESPYRIQTAPQLDRMRNHLDKCFILDDDIDLAAACSNGGEFYNSGLGWLPIGDANNPFTGSLDGAGKSITGLIINNNNLVDTGLFGYVGAAGKLSRINLEDVSITTDKAGVHAGGLAGANAGVISNCSCSGIVKAVGSNGVAGGLVGMGNGTLIECRNEAQVQGDKAGGLIGYAESGTVSMIGNTNSGQISGSYAGGLVGRTEFAAVTINSGGNTGEINGGMAGGGLVGYIYSNNTTTVIGINDSFNTGLITAGVLAGGLIGHSYQGTVNIAGSYNTGAINRGANASYGGGLAGHMHKGKISHSYNTGNVHGPTYAGGITAYIDNSAQITTNYSSGAITGGIKGGLVGAIEDGVAGSVTESYYDRNTSGQSDTGRGIPKSTAEMKQQATFANWDFNALWYIAEGITYPVLRNFAGDMIAIDSLIAADWAALEVGYTQGDNANSVSANLTLPTSGSNGTTITWISSDPSIIATNGTVPQHNGMPVTITLTATISKAGGNSLQKTFALTVLPEFAGGQGTPGNPYLIQTAEQLNKMRNYLSSHFILDNDIALGAACNYGGFAYNSGARWLPVGTEDDMFIGNFDGAGHTISGLFINRPQTNFVGLFGRIGQNATIKNVKLTNVNIYGQENTGGLAGQLNGLEGRITVQKVSVTGAVKGYHCTGGLLGSSHASDISQTSSRANVNQVSNRQYAGGLIGYMGTDSSLADSYSTGTVEKDSGSCAGGLVGYISGGEIICCYAAGPLVPRNSTSAGGLVGAIGNNPAIKDCYYDQNISGQNDTGKGTPKTTAEMKKEATFSGWDFDETWFINEANTYPLLQFADMSEGDRMLRDALNALEIGFAAGDSINSVTQALTLPASGINGTAFTWTSSDTSVITDDGIFARPAGVNKSVTMKATGYKEGVNPQHRAFVLTVLGTQDAPTITGPTQMTLIKGYSVCSTDVFTITGLPEPTVEKSSGDNKIIWNEAAKRLDIAAGLEPGEYVVTFTVKNGIAPDATLNFTLTVLPEFAGGQGTPGNPYLIHTAEQLNKMRNYLGSHFILDNDIDLEEACSPGGPAYNSGAGWLPVGTETEADMFIGNFDGAGHTISGLLINRPQTNFVGLFGRIGQNATIKNVKLTNVNIYGNENTGGLAGQLNGLAGRITVQKVSVTGAVKGYHCTGGLLGSSHASDISQTFSRANVIQVSNRQYAGGLIGYMGTDSSLADSYSTGTVEKDSGSCAGGLVGYISGGEIICCYAAGPLVPRNSTSAGGLAGAIGNNPTIKDCYYDQNISGQNDAGKGTPKTTAEMKQQATFVDWNFDGSWFITEGDTYPSLRWQLADMSEEECELRDALAALKISFAEDDSAGSVTKNLTLPTSGKNGTTFTWTSSDTSVITDDGIVARPAGVNKSITMIATGHKEGVNPQHRAFVLTVLGTQDAPTITGPTQMTLTKGYSPCSTAPYSITGLPEPTVEKSGGDTKITWNAAAKTLVIAAGLEPGDYVVTLTVNNGIAPHATLIFTVTVLPEFAGDGTPGNPYRIQSAEQLSKMRNFLGSHFILDNDIDLEEACSPGGLAYNSGAGWLPVGTEQDTFKGSFDGAGHSISGLFINRPGTNNVGLFGMVSNNAAIKNVRLMGVNVKGKQNTGGLVGYLYGDDGRVTVEKVSVTGQVQGTQCIGGLSGYASVADISQSCSAANVTQTENKGLVGGLVGGAGFSSNFADSYTTGSVATPSFSSIGGLVGYLIDGNIARCYTAAQIVGLQMAGLVGGVGNWQGTTITNSYYDRNTSGQGYEDVGMPKTTGEMQQQPTFKGWDFNSVWQIEEGISYPTLRWQAVAADEAIAADLEAISWDSIKLKNLGQTSITCNLNLPKAGARGSSITWGTATEGWIDLGTGVVTRPTANPLEVALTAAVSKAGGTSRTKTFDLVILPTGPEETGCLVTYRGVQKRLNDDDSTYDIRFLATIDTLDADEVGFVFSKSQLAPTRENGTVKASTMVYLSVTASGASVTAGDLGGMYIVACTVTGIPETDINIPLYVRAFSTAEGETKYTPARKITVSELGNE